MAKRLVEGKRVRTVLMGSLESLVTTVDLDTTVQSYVFQDDVTIIGVDVMGEALALDAHSNADFSVNYIVEVSRQGQRAQPGLIAWVVSHVLWNALIASGGDLRRQNLVMFPEGHGIEVDEGEGINLNVFAQYIGAGGDLAFYPNAIIYYVER